VWEGEGNQKKGRVGSRSGQTPNIVEEGSWWGGKKRRRGDPFRI
jgi:hypothetical protein